MVSQTLFPPLFQGNQVFRTSTCNHRASSIVLPPYSVFTAASSHVHPPWYLLTSHNCHVLVPASLVPWSFLSEAPSYISPLRSLPYILSNPPSALLVSPDSRICLPSSILSTRSSIFHCPLSLLTIPYSHIISSLRTSHSCLILHLSSPTLPILRVCFHVLCGCVVAGHVLS